MSSSPLSLSVSLSVSLSLFPNFSLKLERTWLKGFWCRMIVVQWSSRSATHCHAVPCSAMQSRFVVSFYFFFAAEHGREEIEKTTTAFYFIPLLSLSLTRPLSHTHTLSQTHTHTRTVGCGFRSADIFPYCSFTPPAAAQLRQRKKKNSFHFFSTETVPFLSSFCRSPDFKVTTFFRQTFSPLLPLLFLSFFFSLIPKKHSSCSSNTYAEVVRKRNRGGGGGGRGGCQQGRSFNAALYISSALVVAGRRHRAEGAGEA